MMDHEHIEAESVIERYVTGRLGDDEAAAFEEHLLDCPPCIERVEAAERLQRGLAAVISEDAAQLGVATAAAAVLARSRRRWAVAAGALAVVAVLLGAVALQRGHEVERWKAPAANVPIALLSPLRGAEEAFPVVLPAEGRWTGLWIELGGEGFTGYRAELVDPGGERVWTGEGLRFNELGALFVQLPADLLRPGEWTLEVTGIGGADGRPVPLATFRLAVRAP